MLDFLLVGFNFGIEGFPPIDSINSMCLLTSVCSCSERFGKRTVLLISDSLTWTYASGDVWSLLNLARFSNTERGTLTPNTSS